MPEPDWEALSRSCLWPAAALQSALGELLRRDWPPATSAMLRLLERTCPEPSTSLPRPWTAVPFWLPLDHAGKGLLVPCALRRSDTTGPCRVELRGQANSLFTSAEVEAALGDAGHSGRWTLDIPDGLSRPGRDGDSYQLPLLYAARALEFGLSPRFDLVLTGRVDSGRVEPVDGQSLLPKSAEAAANGLTRFAIPAGNDALQVRDLAIEPVRSLSDLDRLFADHLAAEDGEGAAEACDALDRACPTRAGEMLSASLPMPRVRGLAERFGNPWSSRVANAARRLMLGECWLEVVRPEEAALFSSSLFVVLKRMAPEARVAYLPGSEGEAPMVLWVEGGGYPAAVAVLGSNRAGSPGDPAPNLKWEEGRGVWTLLVGEEGRSAFDTAFAPRTDLPVRDILCRAADLRRFRWRGALDAAAFGRRLPANPADVRKAAKGFLLRVSDEAMQPPALESTLHNFVTLWVERVFEGRQLDVAMELIASFAEETASLLENPALPNASKRLWCSSLFVARDSIAILCHRGGARMTEVFTALGSTLDKHASGLFSPAELRDKEIRGSLQAMNGLFNFFEFTEAFDRCKDILEDSPDQLSPQDKQKVLGVQDRALACMARLEPERLEEARRRFDKHLPNLNGDGRLLSLNHWATMEWQAGQVGKAIEVLSEHPEIEGPIESPDGLWREMLRILRPVAGGGADRFLAANLLRCAALRSIGDRAFNPDPHRNELEGILAASSPPRRPFQILNKWCAFLHLLAGDENGARGATARALQVCESNGGFAFRVESAVILALEARLVHDPGEREGTLGRIKAVLRDCADSESGFAGWLEEAGGAQCLLSGASEGTTRGLYRALSFLPHTMS
jgi:hypothetical protein